MIEFFIGDVGVKVFDVQALRLLQDEDLVDTFVDVFLSTYVAHATRKEAISLETIMNLIPPKKRSKDD